MPATDLLDLRPNALGNDGDGVSGLGSQVLVRVRQATDQGLQHRSHCRIAHNAVLGALGALLQHRAQCFVADLPRVFACPPLHNRHEVTSRPVPHMGYLVPVVSTPDEA